LYSQLAISIGSGMQYHAYTDKILLKKWNVLFEQFLQWTPENGQSRTVSDSVNTDQHTGALALRKSVRFIDIAGTKYLVFTSYQTIGEDDVVAYDEDNVRKMKNLYSELDRVLINK